jgi:uncharacterized protein (DUF1330 family)
MITRSCNSLSSLALRGACPAAGSGAHTPMVAVPGWVRPFCSDAALHFDILSAFLAPAMSLTLCVLLWARPGAEDALTAYEDEVLALIWQHGGRVLQRARSSGADGQPLEIQLLELPSAQALDAYMTDGRRTGLADERDRAVARTEVIPVELRS